MPVLLRKRRGTPLVDRIALLRRARRLLGELGLQRSELSVLLTDDREIAELNARYRSREGPTDVLSFSQQEGGAPLHPELLGDVVISLETAARQASARRRPLLDELTELLVHGVLHLAGREHEGVSRKRASAMRREQQRLARLLARA
ncbi:MAG: rRNA maturation RNase YbeY [Deltaproteobacteria bacterium]|nr:rRNA maturation RNase YbeY [Deltaproteobacteria bacterium]